MGWWLSKAVSAIHSVCGEEIRFGRLTLVETSADLLTVCCAGSLEGINNITDCCDVAPNKCTCTGGYCIGLEVMTSVRTAPRLTTIIFRFL